MQTRVLSLQRWVEVDRASPNTQLSCMFGWKFAPSTVISMPPYVGPVDGMRRWIFGVGKAVIAGEGSGLNKYCKD